MSSARWLDRRIAAPGPYLTLCLHEHELWAALKHIKYPDSLPWVLPGKHATVHTLIPPNGGQTMHRVHGQLAGA